MDKNETQDFFFDRILMLNFFLVKRNHSTHHRLLH